MRTAQAEASVVGPVGSLEVRWMFPGSPRMAVREWFARFPASRETREDVYLVRPRLPGLSVKLRHGTALEVKSFLGSPGILDLPHRGRGRLESWTKWSFRGDPLGRDGSIPAGWVAVGKRRRNCWFSLNADAPAGCAVELAEAEALGEPWWTVGMEATGSGVLLRSALQHAAELVFVQPLPTGAELSLDNSWSYMQWLARM